MIKICLGNGQTEELIDMVLKKHGERRCSSHTDTYYRVYGIQDESGKWLLGVTVGQMISITSNLSRYDPIAIDMAQTLEHFAANTDVTVCLSTGQAALEYMTLQTITVKKPVLDAPVKYVQVLEGLTDLEAESPAGDRVTSFVETMEDKKNE